MLAGQVLYYFESNIRSATIIGIVGAGGIGLHLSEAIRTLEWQEVSFLILMILVAVAADRLCFLPPARRHGGKPGGAGVIDAKLSSNGVKQRP